MAECLPTSNPPAMHGEAVAGRAAKVRRQLFDLSADVKASTFDMIELLCEAKSNGYPLQWGFSSVLDYGTQELGLKERKVQYLTRIGTVCKAVGLTREQYQPAGTSKLREITTLTPEGSYFNIAEHTNEDMAEHIVRLILDSDKMTVEEVKEEVARLKGMTGPNRMVVRSCSVTQSAWTNVIQPAYELARRILGSQGRDESGNAVEYKDGACLEVICAAFNADVNNQPEPEEPQAPPTLPMEEY